MFKGFLSLLGLSSLLLGTGMPKSASFVGSSMVYATFVDKDGVEIYERLVTSGSTVISPVSPVQSYTEDGYKYTFAGWDHEGPIEADTLYRPIYTRAGIDHTVEFINIDGSPLYRDVLKHGEVPTYPKGAPNYHTIDGVVYRFNGWDKALSPIAEDTTYIATYTRDDQRNCVRFFDYNGNVIREDYLADGGIPTVPGYWDSKPVTKDGITRYCPFLGWDHEVGPVYESIDFHPLFASFEDALYSVNKYSDDSGEYYALTGFNGNEILEGGTITLPTTYAGLPIKRLEWLNNTPNKDFSLIVPEGYERISSIRNITNLCAVHLPSTLKSLDWDSFINCPKLSEVYFHQDTRLENFSSNAFNYCNISAITLPSYISNISGFEFLDTNPISNTRTYENGVTYYMLNPTESLATNIENYSQALNGGLRSDCIGIVTKYKENFMPSDASVITIPNGIRFIIGGYFWQNFSGYNIELHLPSTLRCFTEWYNDNKVGKIYFEGDIVSYLQASLSNSLHGQLYIQGEEVTNLVIPEGITKINDYAFTGSRNLTSVTFPSSLKEIGYRAFDRTGLTSVFLPSGLERLGGHAFRECENLAKVVFAEDCNPERLEECVFYYCRDLTEIHLGSALTRISSQMFCGCINLTSIDLPESLTRIEEWGFYDTKLAHVDVPASVEYVGYYGFYYGCEINYEGGIDQLINGRIAPGYRPEEITDMGYKLYLKGQEATDIVIPEGTTALYEGILSNYINIKTIALNNGIVSIGRRAFAYDRALTTINMPTSLSSFTGDIFLGCAALQDISFRNNPYFLSIDGDVYDESGNTLMLVSSSKDGTYEVREGTLVIGDGAFSLCTGVNGIELASTVKVVGRQAAYGLTLNKVVLNDGVEYIGYQAFASNNWNSRISELTLPASLRYFSNSFQGVSIDRLNLKKGFGEGLGWMGSLTSNSINEVHYEGTYKHMLELSFFNRDSNRVYNDNDWNDSFINRANRLYCLDEDEAEVQITIADLAGITQLNPYSAFNSSYLGYSGNVDFESSSLISLERYSLGSSAFSSITFKNLSYISDYAMAGGGNWNVRKVDFRGSPLKELNRYVFENCGNIEFLYLNEGLRYIYERIFGYNGPKDGLVIMAPSTLVDMDGYALSRDYYGEHEALRNVKVLLPETNAEQVRDVFSKVSTTVNITYYTYGEGSSANYWTLDASGEAVLSSI